MSHFEMGIKEIIVQEVDHIVDDLLMAPNLEIGDESEKAAKIPVIDTEKTKNIVQNLINQHETREPKPQEIDQISNLERGSIYPAVSEVLPSLFLCGANAARPEVLERLEVNLVINAAPELPDTPLPNNKPAYLQIPVLDKGDVDLMKYFDETSELIEGVRLSGGRTLVHCVAGVSRSASLCIAYLMKYSSMSLKEAFHHVKRIRPQIRPNIGFFRQLIKYESILGKPQSVSMLLMESLGQEIPDVYQPEYKAMELFYQRYRRHVRRRD